MPVTVQGAVQSGKLFKEKEVIISRHDGSALSGKIGCYASGLLEVGMLSTTKSGTVFQPGDNVTVSFVVDGDSRYEFTAKVTDAESGTIKLGDFSRLRRIDQRESYRIRNVRPLYFKEASREGEWKEGMLLDVSAAGARVACEELLVPGTVVKLLLGLPEVDYTLEVEARVVRATRLEHGYETGLSFLSLTLDDKDRLLEFVIKIYQKEREQ